MEEKTNWKIVFMKLKKVSLFPFFNMNMMNMYKEYRIYIYKEREREKESEYMHIEYIKDTCSYLLELSII